MRFCRRCLYPESHPLGLTFNDDGICSGCLVHDEKYSLDWNERLDKLKKIVLPYKSATGNNFDCIIPVSGSVESFFIVHVVKNILKLNPLLVSYNRLYNTSVGIRNLSRLKTVFDCDLLSLNVNPQTVRKITRYTLEKFGNINWHILAGSSVFPVQTSVRLGIPLIIWGAHQGVEQVGMYSHLHEIEMTRRYRRNHDLFGYEADDLLDIFNNLTDSDIWQYRYPTDSELYSTGVRGIYLSNYIPWDPKSQNEFVISTYGCKGAKQNRTFDTYEHSDCFNYLNLHDQLKLFKHGYSRVTDHAVREIRHKRLSRHQAHSLVVFHELQSPQHLSMFKHWINLSDSGLRFILESMQNSLFFNTSDPLDTNFRTCRDFDQFAHDDSSFESTFLPFDTFDQKSYITIGKGWP